MKRLTICCLVGAGLGVCALTVTLLLRSNRVDAYPTAHPLPVSATADRGDHATYTASSAASREVRRVAEIPASPALDPGTEADAHAHILRSWRGTLSPTIEAIGAAYERGEIDRFHLPAFDGETLAIRIQRFERSRLGGGVLRGTVEGDPASLVSIAQVGSAEAGSLHLPKTGRVYEIRPGADGATIFSEIDVAALGVCQTCLEHGRLHLIAPTPPPPF